MLNPSSLGLLTSAYFLAFAAMQMPVGILLDRYGPRRVEPVLLAIAAGGAALFAVADTLAGLALARAVIGAGVCACLMAPLKAIAAWYPPDRQASYSGWIMVAGGIGALAATVPLEMALRVTHWRIVFMGLAVVTLAVARGDLVARARHREARAFGQSRAAAGGRAVGDRASALLVDRAARRVRHGVVHGDPGTVGGAVADGRRRRHARQRGESPAGDERGHHGRLRRARLFRHAPRAPRHSCAAPLRRRIRGQPGRTGADRRAARPAATSGGRCTAWAPP